VRRPSFLDLAIAGGTLLYLVFMSIPWFRVDGVDFGFGYAWPGYSVNGFDSGLLTFALVLLIAATGWTLLPTVRAVPVPFPRAVVTTALAALAFLITLVEWTTTLDAGFSVMALLTLIASAAVLVVAALRLVTEVRHRPVRAGAADPTGPAAYPQYPSPEGQQGSSAQPGQPSGEPRRPFAPEPHEQSADGSAARDPAASSGPAPSGGATAWAPPAVPPPASPAGPDRAERQHGGERPGGTA
jgi:hypothetical protein